MAAASIIILLLCCLISSNFLHDHVLNCRNGACIRITPLRNNPKERKRETLGGGGAGALYSAFHIYCVNARVSDGNIDSCGGDDVAGCGRPTRCLKNSRNPDERRRRRRREGISRACGMHHRGGTSDS